nr:DNA binding protein [Microvirus sp.]
MTMQYYAIKDNKVAFYNPFLMHNEAEALRAFANLTKDERSEISKAPADYELWHIGQWDDAIGLMTSAGPRYITNGIEVNKNANVHTENMEQI